ncbi:hypothetical protein TW81_03410 [Vibrio galatheae]|uniref:Lipoprotein n=1 Tax=Vibrio galatheae TaxID=579748 RepID=A0A0F4NN79_9VIBR|nr:hypothetical protein [Vibrio galatheae]KJY84587.1 hypothetical protein TW81_03410 [Vibrio galatheae]
MFRCKTIGAVVLCFSSFSNACYWNQKETSALSLMLIDSDTSCFSVFDLESTTSLSDQAFGDLHQAEREDYSSYWLDWLFGTDSNPLISNRASSNYFGLGVWVPSELEKQMKAMDIEDWIKSHGVQFSVGFGDVQSGKPRVRIDYRWHDQYDGDVMMQVEVPF